MEFKDDQLIELYERMLLARTFEEELKKQYALGNVYGPTFLAIGQEASAVGAGAALEPNDFIAITHRNHAQAIGAGVDPEDLMLEIFASKDGIDGGRSGPVEFSAIGQNIIGQNGIPGSVFPIACGIALTQQIKNTGRVVLCFGGDGTADTGYFHEALNLASLWKLPIVFFIENNLYCGEVPLEEHSSVINLSERANTYNMPGITVDGNDVIETYGMTSLAIDYARNGDGPVLIEALTYRLCPDEQSLPETRAAQEIEAWENEDPIPKMADYLVHNEILTQEQLFSIEKEVKYRIRKALETAQKS